MRDYYDRRACEYEQIYTRDDPVRRSELARISTALRNAVGGRRVLEIACGTGYWTSFIAGVAERVLATDISTNMLAVARQKPLHADRVEFLRANAYALEAIPGIFDAAVAIFWISHVPKEGLGRFLTRFHGRLAPGAVVFLADNVFVPGIGGELISRPNSVDTFKRRTLADGSRYEVLKNYYDEDGLRTLLRPWASGLRIRVGTYYWWLTYATGGDTSQIFVRETRPRNESGSPANG